MAPFSPALYLAWAPLQSLGASLPLWIKGDPGSPPPEDRLQVRLEAPNAALHAQVRWAEGRRPAVILVHGVGGSIDSNYLRRAAWAIHRRGMHAVRMNLRGAGDSLPVAPTLYHAGLWEDLEALAATLALDERVASIGAIGFSLGGNLALRWAENPSPGTRSLPRAVASISAPLDLAATSRNLGTFAASPYRWYLMPSLVRQARAFAAAHPDSRLFDVAALDHVRTVWEYDDVVVGPMHGFGTAERYYAESSAGPRLPALTCPALVIHADDDPMVPAASIRRFLGHPQVESLLAPHGGHVGFIESLRERDWVDSWAVTQALDFLTRHLDVPADL